jgi:WD40 repeat protein
VALWDLVRRERIFKVKTPSTLVAGTSFGDSGRLIVGSSSHGEAIFFDAATGRYNPGLDLLPRRRELDSGASVAYTADLTTMLGTAGPVIKMWTPLTGRTIADLTGHSGNVIDLAVCPNQPWAASGSADGTVRIWDLSHAEEIQCFRGHQEAVSSVAFTTDGTKLFSAGSDPGIRIWDFGRPQAFFDFAKRIDHARTALSRNAQDSLALAAMGEWYAYRGLDEWAVELLEQARSNGAKVPILTLARVYWRLNRIEEAKAAFEEAIRSREAPEIYLRQCIGALAR